MKNIALPGIFLMVLFSSCLSPPTSSNPYKPISKIPYAITIGTVEATFSLEATAGYRSDNKLISEAAYIELLKAAKEKYGDNIDIADITWVEVELNIWSPCVFTAGGKVITIDPYAGIEEALAKAAKEAVKNIPKNSNIAIVSIAGADQAAINYIVGELEFILINEGYRLCDRNQLDILRREHKLSLSGEVSDASAISIGKFIGANVIITGNIDGANNTRRLRLRALNSETTQVIGAASERF